jgi:peptidoglycan/LPS O-acetylase OafA/YrhL
MTGRPQPHDRRDFNASLNGYRGFCALLVFGFHLGSAGVVALPHGNRLEDGAAELWTSLAYGVEMFFMISGFVILGSLLRHATLRGFLQDRLVRIYSAWIPALMAVTAVCVVLHMKMFANVGVAAGLGIFIGNLFLLPPLAPLPLIHQGSWSLSYEWVFYLSAVAGVWLIRRRAPRAWSIGAWIALSALFVCLFPRSLFFLTGVVVFSGQGWFRRHERWLKGPLVSLLVFLIAWRLTGADRSSLGDTLFTWVGSSQWLAAVAAFVASLHLFASITLDASRQFAFLRSRAMQFLGTISYSFYLWHALIMSATKRVALGYLVPHYGVSAGFLFFLVSSLALGLLVSWASWALFEVRLARRVRTLLAPIPHIPTARRLPTPGRAPDGLRLRCLWIARYIPYPLDAGAKVYSAKLAESLAEAGAMVRFLGFGDVNEAPERGANIEWRGVPGYRRGHAAAALSSLPIAAAIDATRAYRRLVEAQLGERWDAIVFDGYGAGWALSRGLAYRNDSQSPPAVLVHVSHNHEANLWQLMAGECRGSALKRVALRSNANKASALERRLVRAVDVLTTVSDEDRRSLGAGLDDSHALVLTPGYDGWTAPTRRIAADTPRRVILMGSFQWVAKRENLVRFLAVADPVFREHGIELDVIGEVPVDLLPELRARCRATRFHGFVRDVEPYFARARFGVVPEFIGGGFKLKFLDYIFGRLPVATLSQAAAGLPPELRRTLLINDTLDGLVRRIVSHMDRIGELNDLQARAFALAEERYRWNTRGERLRQAIAEVQQQAARKAVTGDGVPAPRVDLAVS